MELTRSQIKTLNKVAQFDFDFAQELLNDIKAELSTDYTWLNKRIVFKGNDNRLHDAYAYAKD